MASESKRTSRGRQKIEIKKIEKEDDLLVSFSKRRAGIYKKASDMLTLCGGEVGIVIFSPSGKPFSFGHPTIDSVINRFQNKDVPPEHNNYTHQLMEAQRKMRIEELVHQNNELLNQLEGVKELRKSLQRTGMKTTRRRNNNDSNNNEEVWWNAPVDELGLIELRQIYASMAQLDMNISNHLKERFERRNTFFASQTFQVGESSGSLAPQITNPAANFDANMINSSGVGSSAFPHGYGFGGLGH